MNKKILIEIQENVPLAFIKIPTKKGLIQSKTIEIDNLIELLESSKVSFNNRKYKDEYSSIAYDTGILPSDNGVSISRIIDLQNKNKIVVLKKKSDKHDFVYHKTRFENVGLPALVFFLFINKQNIIYRGSLFALKNETLTENTVLYKYPFTNVGIEGDICFGANKESLKINSLLELKTFPDKFLMMPSTHDLGNDNVFGLKMRPWLELLEGIDFENDFLTASKFTYSSYLRYLKIYK